MNRRQRARVTEHDIAVPVAKWLHKEQHATRSNRQSRLEQERTSGRSCTGGCCIRAVPCHFPQREGPTRHSVNSEQSKSMRHACTDRWPRVLVKTRQLDLTALIWPHRAHRTFCAPAGNARSVRHPLQLMCACGPAGIAEASTHHAPAARVQRSFEGGEGEAQSCIDHRCVQHSLFVQGRHFGHGSRP